MKKRFVSAWLLLWLVLPMASARADVAGAKAFVDSMSGRVVEVLRRDAGDKPAIRKALFNVLHDAVDVQWVSLFVLGKYRRQVDEAALKHYQELYAPFMVYTYANRFAEYSGEQPLTKDASETKPGEYLVKTHIVRPDNPQPVLVDYRVRQEGGQYKIYDVVIEGVSMLNSQRQEFGSVISRKGFDYLVEVLDKRVKMLSSR